MSEVNSLSIIENTDMTSFKSTMSKIGQFQKLVRENLQEGKDFGKIPGTSKPTLYKPGAEKILMLMGLQSTYEIIDSTRDWKEGFFQYQVRCTLEKGGIVITQGLGCCNSREKKYINQDPFTMDNTILKMAKKRSQVDASLTVASLSAIFTQDMEDIGNSNNNAPNNELATQPQVSLIKTQIVGSHLFNVSKNAKDKSIVDLLEDGMTKDKASEIISWWLGDTKKFITGERTKRETKEREAKPKTKADKIKQAREIVESPGKVEVKDEDQPFPDEEISDADLPGSSYDNAVPYTGKRKGLGKAK